VRTPVSNLHGSVVKGSATKPIYWLARCAALLAVGLIISAPAAAEKICIKYGPCGLDLGAYGFECTETARSSFVRRVCHDVKQNFLAVLLNDTWYPHCGVRALDVLGLVTAPSVGRHYNEKFRSNRDGNHGPFDCRDEQMPAYPTAR